jgi:hypothetical protein
LAVGLLTLTIFPDCRKVRLAVPPLFLMRRPLESVALREQLHCGDAAPLPEVDERRHAHSHVYFFIQFFSALWDSENWSGSGVTVNQSHRFDLREADLVLV